MATDYRSVREHPQFWPHSNPHN